MDIPAIPNSDAVQDVRREHRWSSHQLESLPLRPDSVNTAQSRKTRTLLYPASSIAANTVPGNGESDLSQIPRKFLRQLLGLNPFRTSYWSLYRPIDDWQSRFVLATGVICSIAAGIPLPIIGVIFSSIIDSFPPPEDELLKSIGELLGVAVAYFFFTWAWSICWGVTGERVSRRFREALVRKAMGMDMSFYDVQDLDITGVLTSSTQAIQMGTSEKVGLFIQSISYFVAAFVVGFILNATLTAVLFAAVIPAMVVVVVSGTAIVSMSAKKNTALGEKAANVAEGAIGSAQVIQAFDAARVLSNDHYRILVQAMSRGIRKSVAGAIMLGCVYFTCYAANALAFYYGSRLTTNGAGTIYAVVFLILDASFVVGQFGPFIQTFAQAASAGSKVLELLDHAAPQINVYSHDGVTCNESHFDGDITLENVSFRYPARLTTRVLDNVNLCIRPHAMTGIVGLSGSGKSTIVGLLLRLYDPFSGRVHLGNTELNDFRVASLRSHISLVDQDPVLFSGTIFDNIRHGIVNQQHLSESEIAQRCRRAALEANANFFSTLPNGIHTKVGMRGGTSLSGGQRQRICLARAIVRRPKLMILDEPTSALDTASEALILDSLKKVSASGCTVIMIAHRLATIRDADNIVVMGQGRVLEQGTHEQLLDREGPYKDLVDAQGMNCTETLPNSTSSGTVSSDEVSLSSIDLSKHSATAEPVSEPPLKPETFSLRTIFSRSLILSRPERPFIIAGVFASIIAGAVVLGEAIVFGHLVSVLNTDTRDQGLIRSRIDLYCLMFFVISLVALFANALSGSMFGLVSESLIVRVRDVSLRTILKQDLAWFSTPGHSPHELMASINMDTGHLSGLSGVIIGTVFSVTTSIVGGIVLAHIVAWKIAIVLLSAVPVMIIAGFFRLRVLAKSEERHETAYNGAAAQASEACRKIRTVAALGREEDVVHEYQAAVYKSYRASFKFNVAGNFTLAFSLAITYFVYALAYWWGSQQVRDGNFTEQDFFIVLPALLFSAQASGQMFSLAPEVTRARSAANSVFRLHDEKPTILSEQDSSPRGGVLGRMAPGALDNSLADPTHSARAALSKRTGTKRGHVQLHRVCLGYPSRPQTLALNDVSLNIEAGQLIGIVGPSGAGKSSVISLLERFYDTQSGRVEVDGVNIRDEKVSEYRNRLSLVSQEAELFAGSIAFNIRLGARAGQTVTQDEVEKVCEECGVHEFIMSLPEGYMTDCGYNGSKLSGGQKQRITIARALIRNPDMLLLDEATASLDSQSEKQVHKAIAAAAKNRTTIMVAHRLSTVQHADNIFVLDKGRVVEQGRHEELIGHGGIYASMVQAQSLGS